jgi:molybdenum cofactor cytidylyltransferase
MPDPTQTAADRGPTTSVTGQGPSPSLQGSPTLLGAPAPALRVGAVILAAGASSRMGTPKQLLALGEQPLLVRAVEAALASPVWPVVVVLGAHAEKIRPTLARLPVLIVENAAWAEGMASSIRTGVTTLRQFSRALEGAVIALCDQPAFSADTIGQLIAAQRTTGRSIVAAHYSGRNGAPALFLRQHFAALAALTGEEGARLLLNGDPAQVTAVDMPTLAVDLDTPADYAALETKLRDVARHAPATDQSPSP